jgi:integrase
MQSDLIGRTLTTFGVLRLRTACSAPFAPNRGSSGRRCFHMRSMTNSEQAKEYQRECRMDHSFEEIRSAAMVRRPRHAKIESSERRGRLSGWVKIRAASQKCPKTGVHIHCPLPPVVMSALKAIPKNGRYYFWTGNGKVKSTTGNWQRALQLLFELAEVPTGHAHRFRDTFAVEALLAGIPLERVSILLGHQSVRVTEKHYSPWVRERQDQIEDDVRRMWQSEKRGHALGTLGK